jgi:hypothetical protein
MTATAWIAIQNAWSPQGEFTLSRHDGAWRIVKDDGLKRIVGD